MKKLALILATALALSACGNDNSNSSSATTQTQTSAPSQEKKTEHYAIGTVPNTPPFVFKDEQGGIVGFEVDITKAIADDQNFSFDWFPSERAVLFNDLESNKYHILSANLAITPERQAKYETSKPYVYAPNVIMGKEGSTAKTLADIGEQKVSVANKSLMHEVLLKANVKNIVTRDSIYDAYTAFIRGEADYVIGDAGVLNHYHTNSGVADKIKVYASIYDASENVDVGYVVQKGNTELLTKLNTGLANIRANGKYDEIYKKWFGDDQSLKAK